MKWLKVKQVSPQEGRGWVLVQKVDADSWCRQVVQVVGDEVGGHLQTTRQAFMKKM